MYNHIKIKEPIWKNRAVGIALDKLTQDIVVEVLYEDKKGNRPFPSYYFMRKEDALAYPTERFGKNRPPMKVIPIMSFNVHYTLPSQD